MGRPLETSSRGSNKMSWRQTTETSWRCSTETSLGVSFEKYLRRRWDVQRNIFTTSSRRLIAGWVPPNILLVDCLKFWY